MTLNKTQSKKRVAIFASYSSDGYLPPQVLPYLEGLTAVADRIVVVCDNDLAEGERERLLAFCGKAIIGRHGEYDFGSYKRGAAWARDNGWLEDADEVILCNDSCFGPVGSFQPMFQQMSKVPVDFWGATSSEEIAYHIQSYWVVLNRKTFTSKAFWDFIFSVKKQPDVRQVILKYELGLTKVLKAAGFSCGAMVDNTINNGHSKDPTYRNLTLFPIHTLEAGLPLVKVKALKEPRTNYDGTNRLLTWLQQHAPAVYESASSELSIYKFEKANDIGISLIMPTWNRAWCIEQAILSVMEQTHCNLELVIVDDGSTDGTEELVATSFATEIAEGKIKYIRLKHNTGVCNARNIGIAHAKFAWIGYADSDNRLRPYYLTMVANHIAADNNQHDAYYGQMINLGTGGIVGKPFDRQTLLQGNFIDLGFFIHKKSLVAKFGGFDPDLKRLVDWDLVIRYTGHKDPCFISRIFLDYTDDSNLDRISVRESYISARVAIHTKHAVKPTITTAIVSYNHEKYLVEAIESALAQKGDFAHEILLSDDGSTDGSHRIVQHYANKYPNKIRNIGRDGNFGISSNYRHCFQQAAGNKIAVLEGDDYWIDEKKLSKQADFLRKHPEAVMVFSRIEAFDTARNSHRLLKRQNNLPSLLTGEHFAADEHLNLIANFSSSMFRKQVVMAMPQAVFTPRLNEICLSFYMDRVGKIGFIDEVMSIYRQLPTSVWTGADKASQLRQSISIRESAIRIARPKYHKQIKARLEQKRSELAKVEALIEPAVAV